MAKRLNVILASMALLALTLACSINIGSPAGRIVRGSGDVVEETREIGAVVGVNLATVGTLYIEIGDDESLRIEAEDNLIELIDTVVRTGDLTIDTATGVNLRPTRPIAYYLTVRDLNAIRLSSSGDVEAPDLEADRFEIRVSSSGNLEMGELTCESCDIRLSSSGDVTLEALYGSELNVRISSSGNLTIEDGNVERQDVAITSSGDYDARDLNSEIAYVQISSSGSATVSVDDRLEADLSSSGNVTYYGDPTVDEQTSSSGDVRRGGE